MSKWKRQENDRPFLSPPSLDCSANALWHEDHKLLAAAANAIYWALTLGGTKLSHQKPGSRETWLAVCHTSWGSMLVCKVAFYMSQMIQNHHFPFPFCWHGSTVGGGGLKKQKLHKDLLVWAKMLVTNALLSVTIRHDVITSILSTKEKSTDTQFHWRWGCWNPAPLADQGVLKTLESIGSGITLQFSHLLAGDFRYVI